MDWFEFAERQVESTYGHNVSVYEKGKSLIKFGTNSAVGTAFETIAQFQGTTANETFVSTNLIDAVSSSSAADTSLTFTIEGQTIDAFGALQFTVQDVTTDATNGQTPVALTKPLARATRIYVKNSGTFDSPQTAPAGIIYVYDNTDGASTGVPTTAAATKVMLLAGATQSEKCATSISSKDYLFINRIEAGVGDAGGSANRIQAKVEIRDVANGGVWRPLGRSLTIDIDQNGVQVSTTPFLIVPPNHDVRMVAKCDANSAAIFGEIAGVLALIGS